MEEWYCIDCMANIVQDYGLSTRQHDYEGPQFDTNNPATLNFSLHTIAAWIVPEERSMRSGKPGFQLGPAYRWTFHLWQAVHMMKDFQFDPANFILSVPEGVDIDVADLVHSQNDKALFYSRDAAEMQVTFDNGISAQIGVDDVREKTLQEALAFTQRFIAEYEKLDDAPLVLRRSQPVDPMFSLLTTTRQMVADEQAREHREEYAKMIEKERIRNEKNKAYREKRARYSLPATTSS